MTELIQTLEKASLDALPALSTQIDDGWLIRRSAGYSRRANCIMPQGPCSRDLTCKTDHAEQLYRADQLPCTFKLTAASQPDNLDEKLAARGYLRDAETLVLTRDLSCPPALPSQVLLLDRPEDMWLETWRSLSPREQQSDILVRLLDAIERPAIYAVVQREGTATGPVSIGCARAVVSDEWVGLFDLAVHADHRGQGYGRSLVDARLAWGFDQGARSAYLQVMEENATAQNLQKHLGFSEAYRYWYRTEARPKC